MYVVVSKARESLARLCESPKSHDLGPGRHHVIRISNLRKSTVYGLPYYSSRRFSSKLHMKFSYRSLIHLLIDYCFNTQLKYKPFTRLKAYVSTINLSYSTPLVEVWLLSRLRGLRSEVQGNIASKRCNTLQSSPKYTKSPYNYRLPAGTVPTESR